MRPQHGERDHACEDRRALLHLPAEEAPQKEPRGRRRHPGAGEDDGPDIHIDPLLRRRGPGRGAPGNDLGTSFGDRPFGGCGGLSLLRSRHRWEIFRRGAP